MKVISSCVCWPDDCDHDGCAVILRDAADADRYPSGARPSQFPAVCPCDCRECRRAWWDARRPIVRNGKIVVMGTLDLKEIEKCQISLLTWPF